MVNYDYHLAEDMVQNALIQAWENLDKYDSNKGQLKSWLAQVARRKTLQCLKIKDVTLVSFNNFDSIQKTNDYSDIYETLDNLPERYGCNLGELLKCYYIHGETCGEIAAKLGCTENTLRWRLNDARNAFRECY